MKSAPFALFAALVFACHARAAVVIDNLTPGTTNFASSITGPVGGGFFSPPPNRQSAFSFITGNSQYTLDALEFLVNVANSSTGIQVALSTGSSVPGGTGTIVLGTAAAATSPVTQLLSVSPSTPVLLAASTRYWIHFTVTSGSGAYALNNTDNVIAATGWTLENTHEFAVSNWNEITSGPQARIRLSATAVPEPTAPLLGGIGLLFLLRRRHRVRV
jgi:hypothetical protein